MIILVNINVRIKEGGSTFEILIGEPTGKKAI